MYDEILQSVIALAQTPSLYASIVIGSLPAENGLCAYIGSGSPDEVHLDRGSLNTLYIVVNGKNADQQLVVQALSDIHKRLTRSVEYPSGTDWSVTNIQTSAAPNRIGEEDSGRQYLWGSILQVDFYSKGVD